MSCLFNSLSHFINLSSNRIRQMVCDYLEQNKPIIDGIETHEVLKFECSNYIARMRSTATWGGAIEIQCACNIWNSKINVFNYRDRRGHAKPIEFLPMSGTFMSVMNLYWTGSHYEPLR